MFITKQNYDNLIKKIDYIKFKLSEIECKKDCGCIYPYITLYGLEDIKIISIHDSLSVGKEEVCLNGEMFPLSSYYPPNETSLDRAAKERNNKNKKEKK